jgi:hypothetical protein
MKSIDNVSRITKLFEFMQLEAQKLGFNASDYKALLIAEAAWLIKWDIPNMSKEQIIQRQLDEYKKILLASHEESKKHGIRSGVSPRLCP